MNKLIFLLKSNSHKKSFKNFINNFNWQFTEQILKLLISFFVNILVIRYLGPEQFGTLNYFISIVIIYSTISKLGLDDIAVFELTKIDHNLQLIFSNIFSIKLLASFSCFIIAIFINLISQNENIYIFLILSLTILISPFEIVEFYFRSINKPKYSSIIRIFSLIAFSIVRLIVIYFESSLIVFAAIILCEALLSAFIASFIINKKFNINFRLNFNLPFIRRVLNLSWPLLISALSIILYTRMDQIMISNLVSLEQNGYYSLAVRLVEVLYFIPVIFVNIIYPILIKNDVIAGYNLQKIIYASTFYCSLIISIFLYLFCDDIIFFLFNNEFEPAIKYFRTLIWLFPLISLGVSRSKWIVIENLQNLMFFIMLFSAILNFSLNYFLIIQYGVIGAAYSTVITTFLVVFILPLLQIKLRKSVYQIIQSIFLRF